MKRADLEKHLGKKVKLILFDGTIIQGYLAKTHDDRFKNNANLYIPINYYFTTESPESEISNSCIFRTSHVAKIDK